MKLSYMSVDNHTLFRPKIIWWDTIVIPLQWNVNEIVFVNLITVIEAKYVFPNYKQSKKWFFSISTQFVYKLFCWKNIAIFFILLLYQLDIIHGKVFEIQIQIKVYYSANLWKEMLKYIIKTANSLSKII